MKRSFVVYFSFLVFIAMISVSCNKGDCNRKKSCENGGVCVDGTCDCPDGFKGINCEQEIVCKPLKIEQKYDSLPSKPFMEVEYDTEKRMSKAKMFSGNELITYSYSGNTIVEQMYDLTTPTTAYWTTTYFLDNQNQHIVKSIGSTENGYLRDTILYTYEGNKLKKSESKRWYYPGGQVEPITPPQINQRIYTYSGNNLIKEETISNLSGNISSDIREYSYDMTKRYSLLSTIFIYSRYNLLPFGTFHTNLITNLKSTYINGATTSSVSYSFTYEWDKQNLSKVKYTIIGGLANDTGELSATWQCWE
ncbi:MAG: calcium-binding EGF-like domain-containing protein [Cellulosilyticaceae bacterium]